MTPKPENTDGLKIVVSAMALSLMTCDLGAVFELIGATSACAVSGQALNRMAIES